MFALRPFASPLFISAVIAAGAACGPAAEGPSPQTPTLSLAPGVDERYAEFAPTVLEANLDGLTEQEREVLTLLIEASRPLDEIFLRQANADNERYRLELLGFDGVEGALARAYFALQKGVYERQHDWRPFVEGVPPRPPGGGFYPADLTKEEFNAYVEAHPDREAELVSLTTIVTRDGEELVGVPYSRAFAPWIGSSAEKLTAAARVTRDEPLRAYLRALVDALQEDRYLDADMAWMDLDGRVELTFGPYEVYEDELFGYKASFESFVTIVDPAESARLARLKELLPAFERGLPIADEHKNFARGAESPIRVADLVFSAGDARAGIQTIAFNLPNDEEVREKKGSKKVLLRNVMAAKFDAILEPIARTVLAPEQAGLVSQYAFLDEVLHHELSHGLGPGRITVDGQSGEVREFLLDSYSAIEEAKADVVGVWNLLAMFDSGSVSGFDRDELAATYLAGLFRAARFGTASAHGKGAAVQFRLLRKLGVIDVLSDSGRVRLDVERFGEGIREVAGRLLTIQALGDREAAERLLAEHGEAPEEMLALMERLDEIPIDIRPIYPLAGEARLGS